MALSATVGFLVSAIAHRPSIAPYVTPPSLTEIEIFGTPPQQGAQAGRSTVGASMIFQARRFQTVPCIDSNKRDLLVTLTCLLDADTGRLWQIGKGHASASSGLETVLWPIRIMNGFGADVVPKPPTPAPAVAAPTPTRQPRGNDAIVAAPPAEPTHGGSAELPPGYVLDMPPAAPRHR
jgi:hypothetical protein